MAKLWKFGRSVWGVRRGWCTLERLPVIGAAPEPNPVSGNDLALADWLANSDAAPFTYPILYPIKEH